MLPGLIFGVASLGVGATLLFPAIPWLQGQYPNIAPDDAVEATTLPTLVNVPFALAAGLIMGRRIGFAAFPFSRSSCSFIGGLLPVAVPHDWTVVIVGSLLRGAGGGRAAALPATLATTLWTDDKASTYMGWATGSISAGSMLERLRVPAASSQHEAGVRRGHARLRRATGLRRGVERMSGSARSLRVGDSIGPVSSILTFGTFEEGIRRANNVHYGLAGGVWAPEVAKAHRTA